MRRRLTLKIFCLGIILLISTNAVGASEISGIVTDVNGIPIENAIVRLQGSAQSVNTDSDGNFVLNPNGSIKSKYITAWKIDYFNGGQAYVSGLKSYHITLKSINKIDNSEYKWLSSFGDNFESTTQNGQNENKPCKLCHPPIVQEWQEDAHSGAAKNKLFLAFFNGTDVTGNRDVGIGYRTDFPNSNGNCATCHIPALGLKNPFNADPNTATGIEKEGVFCDFCHKIKGVTIDSTGGHPGILSIRLNRPKKGEQIFYGPHDDVFPGDDSCHPLYKKSQYCAPCHHGFFWDVLAYSEFQEWAESSYAVENIHCQNCHMESDEKKDHFALENKGGILRDAETISSHVNFGVKDKRFMEEAIDVKTHAAFEEDTLNVVVTIKNSKAGHHYPTGNPMRNMILLVDARNSKGESLPMIEGETVPAWGGIGDARDGNYAGLPGKGFAKVLKDVLLYPDRTKRRDFDYEYPAPHWRPALVESDNRIPANGNDVSTYRFSIYEPSCSVVEISTRLIYRRAYKTWLDEKGFQLPDLEICQKRIGIRRSPL